MAAPTIVFGENPSSPYTVSARVFSQSPRVVTFGGTATIQMVESPYQPQSGLNPKLYTCDANGAFWGLTGAYTDFPMWTGASNFPLNMNLRQFWGFTLNRTGIFDFKYMPSGTGSIAKSAGDSGSSTPFVLPNDSTQITRGRNAIYGAAQIGGGPLQSNCGYFKFKMNFPSLSFINQDLTSSPVTQSVSALLLQDDFHQYTFNSSIYPIRTSSGTTAGIDTWPDPSWYNSLNTEGVCTSLFPTTFSSPVTLAEAASLTSAAGETIANDTVFTLGDSVAFGGYGGVAINPITGVATLASMVPFGEPWGATAYNVYTVANDHIHPGPTIERPTLFQIELSKASHNAGFSGTGWLTMNLPTGGSIFWKSGASSFYFMDPTCQNYYLVNVITPTGAAYDLPGVNEWGVDLNGVVWALNGADTLYWSGGLPIEIAIDVPMLGKLFLNSASGHCMSCVPWLGGPPS